MKNTNRWKVTLKRGMESIVVESTIDNASDLLTHFEENIGVIPSSIEKL